MLLLPLPASPAYNVITAIDGVDYELVYTYDEHRDLWRFGVNSRSGDVVMGHRPLLPFAQMRPNAFASTLEGVFALIAPLPTNDAYEALTGGLWSVVYGTPEEIAELAESLADLAGDVAPKPEPEPEPDPVDWDGDYETLPNLVAGWLPDRGLFKDAEGTQPAGEGDTVLGWQDFVQGALLPHSEADVAFVIGGVATLVPSAEESTQSMYVGEGLTLAGSITETVVGSVPRDGEVEPVSSAVAIDDFNGPSLVMYVTSNFESVLMSTMGGIAAIYDETAIILPEYPSYPVSLRVVGSNAELANLSGALGEQVGYAEPVVGVKAAMVYTAIEGADYMPLSPVLLFSEPLDAETRTQLFNKLKNDFPAWI